MDALISAGLVKEFFNIACRTRRRRGYVALHTDGLAWAEIMIQRTSVLPGRDVFPQLATAWRDVTTNEIIARTLRESMAYLAGSFHSGCGLNIDRV